MSYVVKKLAAISSLILPCYLFFCPSVLAQNQMPASQEKNDIRIIIDVSGSMKQNDPHNLRAPALRLLAELLPNQTSAGVWTFGKFVNLLIPYQEVNQDWKDKAHEKSASIHSFGLRTNIENAIEQATWDWTEKSDTTSRSILLLTDGIVDISDEDKPNKSSRDIILANTISRLKNVDAKVYAIALSEQSDKALLQQLASQTGGWYETTQSAENLEKLFLKIFMQSINPETIPLQDNAVLIDDSVNEVTFLIFNQSTTQPTEIANPNNELFSHADHPQQVRWHHEDRFDLITVTQPTAGNWILKADMDPDNKAMVVSNLKLKTKLLPRELLINNRLTFETQLVQEEKTITSKDFLKLLKINLSQTSENGIKTHWRLKDNGGRGDATAYDGVYSIALNDSLTVGEHKFTVKINGKTFKREHTQRVRIYSGPVQASISYNYPGHEHLPVLVVVAAASLTKPGSIKLIGTIKDENGKYDTLNIPQVSQSEWVLPLNEFSTEVQHTIYLSVRAQTQDDELIKENLTPLTFGAKPETLIEHQPNPHVEPLPEPEPHEIGEPAEPLQVTHEDPEALHWSFISTQVLFFNIILGLLLFYGYKKWFAPSDHLTEESYD